MNDAEAELEIRKYLNGPRPMIGDIVSVAGDSGEHKVVGQYPKPAEEYYYIEQWDGAWFVSDVKHMTVIRREFK
jgi:hypothetical protein